MVDEPTKQDWAVLDLKPGARPAQVQRAYQRRRALYEREVLATYTLLSEAERGEMLERIDRAYRRIMGQSPTSGPRPSFSHETMLKVRRPPVAHRAESATLDQPAPTREATVSSPTAETSTLPAPSSRPTPPAPVATSVAPEPDPTREPGAFLRYHRQQLGISIQAVADETKIRSLQIEKIEGESYSGLPATVYVRGFVIQYARFLGIPDPEAVAASFLNGMETNTSSDSYR
jgi:hypothetical protein